MDNTIKDLVITLRVYKGKETYDKNGKLNSETQTFKLRYARLEWRIFLKTINQLNYSKVEAIKCLDVTKRGNQHEVGIPESVHSDIKKATGAVEVPLTPEQQEIKKLKAQMEEMKGLIKSSKPKKKEKKEPVQTTKAEMTLEDAKKAYQEKFNKKPYHGWNLEQLQAKLDS